MITEGKYSSSFKTPIGEGMGIVELRPNGTISGGDATFAYSGNWEAEGERVRAVLSAKRVVPGPPGVFGLDAIDIVANGKSKDGKSIIGTGFARQAPGVRMDVVLERLED